MAFRQRLPQAILISDEQDEDENDQTREVNLIIQRIDRIGAERLRRSVSVIDLTAEEQDRREVEVEAAVLRSLALDYNLGGHNVAPANVEIPESRRIRGNYELLRGFRLPGGLIVKNNCALQIRSNVVFVGEYPVEFLTVHEILKNKGNGNVLLRGLPYLRTRSLNGLLPQKLNELVILGQANDWVNESWKAQSIIEIPIEHVGGTKREIYVTNETFPHFRFTQNEYLDKGHRGVEKSAHLVCRWAHVYSYASPEQRSNNKAREFALIHLSQEHADPRFRVKDTTKLNRWRGGKARGGSDTTTGEHKVHVTIENPDPESDSDNESRPRIIDNGRTYRTGDFFSGCGGVSRGMVQALTKVVVAVDHWEPAVASYKANFPNVVVDERDIFDYIQDHEANRRLDIVHLSPPCQVYSPAHTIEGQNDEANLAALFSCRSIIEKHKPRLFTLEQTFGILHEKSIPYFRALVQGFTALNYSVRWAVLSFLDYGLAQPRRRLIMIGAGPGESLPTLPRPTHGNWVRDGLLPVVTARKALSSVKSGMQNHDPTRVRHFPIPKARWNADSFIRHTITCSGIENYHWDGRRDFTIRELATLQGFPPEHKFVGPREKKQIGNAFPPLIVKMLYTHLVAWLDKRDGFDPAECARRRARHQRGRNFLPQAAHIVEIVDVDVNNDQDRDQDLVIASHEEAAEVSDDDDDDLEMLDDRTLGRRTPDIPVALDDIVYLGTKSKRNQAIL
jgi:DNA (cytosine-5)-methyltransferase 1